MIAPPGGGMPCVSTGHGKKMSRTREKMIPTSYGQHLHHHTPRQDRTSQTVPHTLRQYYTFHHERVVQSGRWWYRLAIAW